MDSPNSWLQGFILITGIAGQLFVAHRKVAGFYWWIACNLAIILGSYSSQSWGMVGLYLFYTAMCVYSIRKWRAA